MYIKNDDLDFLIHLENKLGQLENWSEDTTKLWELVDRLIAQRKSQNEYTRNHIAEKRKIDKNYGRKKAK